LKNDDVEDNDKRILSYIAFNKEEHSELWDKFSDNPFKSDTKKIIGDTIYRLELMNIDRQKSELQTQTKDSVADVDSMNILKKIIELDKRKTELKIKYEQ
jgi:hypothetical protein